MGAKPKAMEEIKAVIRLHRDGFSNYAIQEHTGISLPTIRKYLRSLKEADLQAGEALRLDHQSLSALCLPHKPEDGKNNALDPLEQSRLTTLTLLKGNFLQQGVIIGRSGQGHWNLQVCQEGWKNKI